MGNYSKGNPGYTNIEFERVIFEDINRAYFDKSSIGLGHFERSTTEELEALKEYKNWIMDLTDNGTTFPIINDQNSTQFKNDFKQYLRSFDSYGNQGYRNGGRDESLQPKGLMEFFKQSVSNCN